MRKNALFGAIFILKTDHFAKTGLGQTYIKQKLRQRRGTVVLVLGDDAWLGFYRGFQASLMLQGVDLLRDRVVRAKKEKEKEKEKQLNTR